MWRAPPGRRDKGAAPDGHRRRFACCGVAPSRSYSDAAADSAWTAGVTASFRAVLAFFELTARLPRFAGSAAVRRFARRLAAFLEEEAPSPPADGLIRRASRSFAARIQFGGLP